VQATAPKNPVKVRAGQIGSRARWGPPRHVRLDSLTIEQRNIVLALVEAAKAAKEEPTAIEQPVGSTSGGTSDATTQV
jgi:hypothetical protein